MAWENELSPPSSSVSPRARDMQQASSVIPWRPPLRHRRRWCYTSRLLDCVRNAIGKWPTCDLRTIQFKTNNLHFNLSCVSLGVPWRSLNRFFRSLVLSAFTCSLSSTTDCKPSFESCRWKIFSSTVPVACNGRRDTNCNVREWKSGVEARSRRCTTSKLASR